MRTQKGFRPKLMQRWLNTGRGRGVFSEYQPWHQVSRSDPGSRGRSHLIPLYLLVHLLSDLELTALHVALLLPDAYEIREQYPLAPEPHAEDLGAYDTSVLHRASPGTRALAKGLGITPPVPGRWRIRPMDFDHGPAHYPTSVEPATQNARSGREECRIA